MTYKVGDKVIIVRNLCEIEDTNDEGEMDHWAGQVMTIRAAYEEWWPGDLNETYRMEEDWNENDECGGWYWNEAMIEGLYMPFEVSTEDLASILG